MIVAELAAEIAERFDCVQGRLAVYCQTGEPYVTIGREATRTRFAPVNRVMPIRGVIRECHAPERGSGTQEGAIREFSEAFDDYVSWWRGQHSDGAAPTLYWRYAAPHMFWDDFVKKGLFRVRCRLVLSNRPVVTETDEQYDARRTAQLEQEFLHGQRQQPQPSDEG